MRSGARVRLGLVLLGVACSSLAELPSAEECTEGSCGEGFVCHQGRCQSNDEAAPRAHLGFDIRETAASNIRFRVEVDGCDCTIEESFRELSLRRPRVSQDFQLSATGPDAPDEMVPNGVFDAEFQLTQPSRFGQTPSPQLSTAELFSPPPDDTDPILTLTWPHNHPRDQNVAPPMVLWKVDPQGALALRYVALVPPTTIADQPCTVDAECDPPPNFCDTDVGQCSAVGQPGWRYHYDYQPACSRPLRGDVMLIGSDFTRGPSLSGVGVELRYADPDDGRFGTHIFGDVLPSDRPPECDDDDDCDPQEQYCDPETRQCFVALAGRPADRGSSSDLSGEFRTQVYSYCDLLPNDGPTRRYRVTVVPPGPLPAVNYLVSAAFPPPPQDSMTLDDFELGDFCIPDWGVDPTMDLAGQGVPMELLFTGSPLSLVEGAPEYTCCDIGCLPTTAEDAMVAPSPGSSICDGSTRAGAPPLVRVQTHFVLDDPEAWDAADCAPLDPDAQGRAGTLARPAQCPAPGQPCRVDDIAPGTDAQPRSYEVRIESQVGSVVASRDVTVAVGATAPQEPLELMPRTLVRGFVNVDEAICALRDSGEDCAAREAIVLAERIRLPTEADGSVPGPYFHHVPTFYDPVAQRDGAFVLPLDPGGVYVVTALPQSGAEGGPAGFSVIDLREPGEVGPLTLVLGEGVVVSLRLELFDQRTVVIPLDRGSYLAPGHTLLNPALVNTADPFIDLNRVGQCWTTPEGPQGCQIRRLIPPGSDLARSQVGVVRFTARRSDQAECTSCDER